jgi:hypothetical protein
MTEMTAPCGIDCTGCPIRRAAGDPDYAEKLAQEWRKEGHSDAVAGWFTCQGCHGDDSLVWGDDCRIRQCCIHQKKLDNCSFCNEFPCNLIRDFESDEHDHHTLAVANMRSLRIERQ